MLKRSSNSPPSRLALELHDQLTAMEASGLDIQQVDKASIVSCLLLALPQCQTMLMLVRCRS